MTDEFCLDSIHLKVIFKYMKLESGPEVLARTLPRPFLSLGDWDGRGNVGARTGYVQQLLVQNSILPGEVTASPSLPSFPDEGTWALPFSNPRIGD